MTMHLLLVCGGFFLLVQGRFAARTDHEKELRCQQWASNKQIRQIIHGAHERASPCPCHSVEAELEHTYEQIYSCFTEYLYTDGVKQRCCYNADGNLLMNKLGAGYLLVETMSDKIEEAYQNCCHGNNVTTCRLFYDINPSNDCSGYITPQYRSSGGDIHITTIDGVEYDFNGHGEYVFLKLQNESLEIQIRTDYAVPGNKDATIITAVAIKVNQTVFNIVLNRKTKVATLYRNSSHSILSSTILQHPIPNGPFFIVSSHTPDNTFHIVYKRGLLTINVRAGEYLDIHLKPQGKIVNEAAIGLAGSTVNGTLVSGNGTTFSVNSSEHDFFDFGESWSLKNEQESAFDYNVTNGSFLMYNSNHTKPRFLEDLVGNLTELFKNSTAEQIDKYNKTCEENKECLLAIARTDNIHMGEIIMDKIHQDQLRKEFLANTGPYFFGNWTKLLNISYENIRPVVLDLKALTGDKEDTSDQLRFAVQTTINDTDFSLENGVFNWTHIAPSLRYADISLTFVVMDHLNFTNHTDVTILYCGCEKESQCRYNDVDLTGDWFRRVGCSCNDSWLQGEFCEIHVPPCNITTCFENVTCDNNATNKDNPCGPCPSGYTGDGSICNDLDECSLNYCEQGCNNTAGSYSCSCRRGYTLATNKRNCTDVDECMQRTDNCSSYSNTRCRNIPGGFICDCKPKYHKALGGSGNCEEGGFSYVAQINLDTHQHQNVQHNYTLNSTETALVKTQISALFVGKSGILSIEIISARFILVSSRRKKREVKRKLVIEFIVVTDKQTSTTNLTNELKDKLGNMNKTSKIWDLPVNDLNLNDAVEAIPENDNKLCEVNANTCERRSTECKQLNGTTFCDCKPGFVPLAYGLDYCDDVNECLNATYLGTNTTNNRCFQGQCQNTQGSWTCECPPEKTWKQTGEDFYRCLDDYQYIGNLSFHLLDEYNYSRIFTAVLNELNDLFNTSTVVVAENLRLDQVFLGTEILDVRSINLSAVTIKTTFVTINYIIHIGTSVSWETFGTVQNRTFKAWNWTLAGDNFTGYIYDETVYSLCDIPGRTDCQVSTSVCNVRNGSYHCDCKQGFSQPNPMKSEKYCIDTNECEVFNCTTDGANCCSGKGQCDNLIGNWSCACDIGFEATYHSYSNITCTDVNECSGLAKDACGEYGHCINTKPGWYCDCEQGFYNKTIGNLQTCTDVDECSVHNCSRGSVCCSGHGTCRNLIGNWTCDCSSGYQSVYHSYRNITCEDINECLHNDTYICTYGHCDNSVGDWMCRCDTGYQPRNVSSNVYICEDIDECSSNSYKCENGTCENLPGGWSCNCPTGYRNNSITQSNDGALVRCENKNECNATEYGYAACLEAEKCVDTEGSWECLCGPGQTVKQLNSTTKICGGDYQYARNLVFTLVQNRPDPAKLKTELQAMLLNLYVSGLKGQSPNVYLEVIDIKLVENKRLKRDAVPSNSRDYRVTYIVHTDVKLPEKNISKVMEDRMSSCQNDSCPEDKLGTYRISIRNEPKVYEQTMRLCDIPSKNYCEQTSTHCTDTNDTIACACKDGFEKDPFSHMSCQDINECAHNSTYRCLGNTSRDGHICEDLKGSWTCLCQPGFEPKRIDKYNVTCIDIDECTDTKYVCQGTSQNPKAAECSNTVGNWSCSCKDGYRKTKVDENKYVCEDINECAEMKSGGILQCNSSNPSRSYGAICNNTDGGWACTCASGFTRQIFRHGKQFFCKDTCDDTPCQNEGHCIHKDNEDNYTCVCTAGWSGRNCDVKKTDTEASHLKTILIACGASAAAVIVLLILAVFGVWRFRRPSSKQQDERLSLNTFGPMNSWPHKNGNVYTSASDGAESLQSDRHSPSVSIPRAQLGKSTSNIYVEEPTAVMNPAPHPAPDYDLHFPAGVTGVTNPAPDYGPDDSPVLRRPQSRREPRVRSGSFGRQANNYNNDLSRERKSTPAHLTNGYSYL